MYHPSRGGVRGGADQFSWENVKTDKHRENYLGHSVMAPVGRWQKGKDLSWYSKDRTKNIEEKNSSTSEIAAIKRAEEEAMLAALGHKVVRKEAQPLTKEEMAEVLKRSQVERDNSSVDRVEGVGIASARAAMLVHSGKHGRTKTGGVTFEAPPLEETNSENSSKEVNKEASFQKCNSNTGKKGSKKHKKEKKHKKKKKHKKRAYSDSSDSDNKMRSSNERHAEKHPNPKACKSISKESSDNVMKYSASNKEKRKERQFSTSGSDSDAVKETFNSDSESYKLLIYSKESTKTHSYGRTYSQRKRHDSTSDSEADKKSGQSKKVCDSTSQHNLAIEHHRMDFRTKYDGQDKNLSSKHVTYKSNKNRTSVSQSHDVCEKMKSVVSQKYKSNSSHASKDSLKSNVSSKSIYKKKADADLYENSDKQAEKYHGNDFIKRQKRRHDSSSE